MTKLGNAMHLPVQHEGSLSYLFSRIHEEQDTVVTHGGRDRSNGVW